MLQVGRADSTYTSSSVRQGDVRPRTSRRVGGRRIVWGSEVFK